MWLVVGEDHWKKTLGNIQQLPFSGGGYFGKILPYPSALRSPRPNNNPGGITAPPISKQATQRPPRHTAAPNLIQRQSPTHQRDRNQPHLPVGRHQEAYSKPPYQLQPPGGRTPEVREATALLSVKRSPHQKRIKMKRQRSITQRREKGKPPENQLRGQESLSLQEKDAEEDARHWK